MQRTVINIFGLFLLAGRCVHTSPDVASSQGRFFDIVRLNPTARFNIGIQITVPVSFFMPNWGRFGRQSRSMSLTEYRWSTAARQSKASFATTCPTERVELEDYLYMLQIDVESCQKRFVCEIAADPERFAPISEIFLKKLAFNVLDSQSRGGAGADNSSGDGLLQAARTGANYRRQCHLAYKECPVAADAMVNMSYLWMWQLASRLTNIRFAGETDNSVFGL